MVDSTLAVGLIQTGLLAGIMFRLGSLKGDVRAARRRLRVVEQRVGVGESTEGSPGSKKQS